MKLKLSPSHDVMETSPRTSVIEPECYGDSSPESCRDTATKIDSMPLRQTLRASAGLCYGGERILIDRARLERHAN